VTAAALFKLFEGQFLKRRSSFQKKDFCTGMFSACCERACRRFSREKPGPRQTLTKG